MALKPEHAKRAEYFNLDNGTGRIRGVWLQGNLAARPAFKQWIVPLHDLGVTILGPRAVAATDHSSFDAVGLPGLQVVQAQLAKPSRSPPSNIVTSEHAQPSGLVS